MKGSLTIGQVGGIPIRVHFTLFFILPYLAFLMATRFYPVAERAGVSGEAVILPPWAWGLLLAVLLFGCVLLHELGHSLLAVRMGGRVTSITLMLLGGVSELHGLPQRPKVEGLVAVAGPLVSLALAALGFAAYRLLSGPPDVQFGLYYLAQINFVLAIFNLLPAFPMDGGRVLRAVLSIWWPRVKATRMAATAGTFFAALFIVGGFLLGNLILMLIGVFVWSGANAEAQMVQQEAEFSTLKVRDVMSRTREIVEASDSVSHAAEIMASSRATALPVVSDASVIGVIAAHHVEALSPDERERTSVGAITQRKVPELNADQPLPEALQQMAEMRTSEAPVMDDGALAGVLEVSDLNRVMRLRRLRAQESEPQRARRPFLSPQPDAVHQDRSPA